MKKKILILQGHPDPSKERLCEAIAQRYADGARETGYEVNLVRPADVRFPLIRSKADFYENDAPDVMVQYAAALQACDHLVLIFPLWLGGMPAYFRGFIEQLMRPGVALEKEGDGFPKGLLKGKSARIIVTMGMPGFAFRWFYGAHSIRGLIRNILKFSGIAPVRTTYYGMAENKPRHKIEADLEAFRRMGQKAR